MERERQQNDRTLVNGQGGASETLVGDAIRRVTAKGGVSLCQSLGFHRLVLNFSLPFVGLFTAFRWTFTAFRWTFTALRWNTTAFRWPFTALRWKTTAFRWTFAAFR